MDVKCREGFLVWVEFSRDRRLALTGKEIRVKYISNTEMWKL